jgi:hypothetical protein
MAMININYAIDIVYVIESNWRCYAWETEYFLVSAAGVDSAHPYR